MALVGFFQLLSASRDRRCPAAGPPTVHRHTSVTRLVCGYFELDRDIDHPLVAELPAFLHVADVDRRWVDWLATLSSMLMAEAGSGQPGSDTLVRVAVKTDLGTFEKIRTIAIAY